MTGGRLESIVRPAYSKHARLGIYSPTRSDRCTVQLARENETPAASVRVLSRVRLAFRKPADVRRATGSPTTVQRESLNASGRSTAAAVKRIEQTEASWHGGRRAKCVYLGVKPNVNSLHAKS